MNVLLAAFAKIAKHGEGAAVQIVVGNEGDRYNHHYKKMVEELGKGKKPPRSLECRRDDARASDARNAQVDLPAEIAGGERKRNAPQRRSGRFRRDRPQDKIAHRTGHHPSCRLRSHEGPRRRPALQPHRPVQPVRRSQGEPSRFQESRQLEPRPIFAGLHVSRIRGLLRDATLAFRDHLDLPLHCGARHDLARAQEELCEAIARARRNVTRRHHARYQPIRRDRNTGQIRARRTDFATRTSSAKRAPAKRALSRT